MEALMQNLNEAELKLLERVIHFAATHKLDDEFIEKAIEIIKTKSHTEE